MALSSTFRLRVITQPKVRLRVTPALIPADGKAATIEISTVTTLDPGEPATVENVGNENAAVFNFGIPQGEPGIGQVESVNEQQGVVVLDADDIDDTSTTNKFTTQAEIDKLSLIEPFADVTDTANVDAAGAVMNTDTSTAAMSFVLDEDDMASNSATKLPTQQSVKAYVDGKTLVSVRTFGASPAASAAVNDAAFAAAIAASTSVYVPAGTYALSARLAVGDADLCLIGDGSSVTQLRWASGTQAGIYQTATNSDQMVKIVGLRLVTTLANPGNAIDIDFSASTGNFGKHAFVQDVQVLQESTGYWSGGMRFDNVRRLRLDACMAWGDSSRNMDFGYSLEGNCNDSQLTACNVVNSDIGVNFSGTTEGPKLSQCVMIGVRDGVVFDCDTPFLAIVECHIAAHERCVNFLQGKQWFIDSCLFYVQSGSAGPWIGVKISGSNNKYGHIANTMFHGPDVAVTRTGIHCDEGRNYIGTNLTFYGLDTGILIDSGVTNCLFTNLQYDTVSTPFTNNGGATNLIESDLGRTLDAVTDGRAAAAAIGTWKVIGHSGAASSHTGNTTETALATVTIPAGAMGPNGILRVTTNWTITNNANNKTLRQRLGGLSGSAFRSITLTTTATLRDQIEIHNRNAQNSQVAHTNATYYAFGQGSGAQVTASQDTSTAKDLVISGLLGNAADTITLESYTVELLYGA